MLCEVNENHPNSHLPIFFKFVFLLQDVSLIPLTCKKYVNKKHKFLEKHKGVKSKAILWVGHKLVYHKLKQ